MPPSKLPSNLHRKNSVQRKKKKKKSTESHQITVLMPRKEKQKKKTILAGGIFGTLLLPLSRVWTVPASSFSLPSPSTPFRPSILRPSLIRPSLLRPSLLRPSSFAPSYRPPSHPPAPHPLPSPFAEYLLTMPYGNSAQRRKIRKMIRRFEVRKTEDRPFLTKLKNK